MKNLGFIGTGKIGSAMISCMLKRRFSVRAWNRTRSKALLLTKEGAVIEENLEDVFSKEKVVFLSLGDGKDVIQIISKGKPKQGTLIVNTSTVDPGDTKKIEAMLRNHKVMYVEAPVLSAPPKVALGETSFIVGGDKAAKNLAKKFLYPIAANVTDGGSATQAAAAKITYNLLHGIIVAGTVESMVLAKELGLKPELMRELFSKGTVNCSSVIKASNAVFSKDKKLVTFFMKHRLKDSKIASDCAKRAGQKLPVHESATLQYEKGIEAGLGEQSPTAIWQIYKKKKRRKQKWRGKTSKS